MYLGIDLGTSAVKALLVDGSQNVVAQSSAPLEVERPEPLWSEQDPHAWWDAVCEAIDRLRSDHAKQLSVQYRLMESLSNTRPCSCRFHDCHFRRWRYLFYLRSWPGVLRPFRPLLYLGDHRTVHFAQRYANSR